MQDDSGKRRTLCRSAYRNLGIRPSEAVTADILAYYPISLYHFCKNRKVPVEQKIDGDEVQETKIQKGSGPRDQVLLARARQTISGAEVVAEPIEEQVPALAIAVEARDAAVANPITPHRTREHQIVLSKLMWNFLLVL